jgi:Protein of unknown function (DUF3185)
LTWPELNSQRNPPKSLHAPGKQESKIMNKGIGIALLVVGIVLIVYGFNASGSVSSGVSRAFTGAPTDRTLWMLLGGSAAAIVGAFMTFRRSGKA